MTKSELVDRLCQASGISLVRAEAIVNAIFDSVESALVKGERTEIRGFGSFEVRNYGQYAGRNPRSGSTVVVKAKRLPFFKAGKELKDRINEAAQMKFATRRGPLSSPRPTAPDSAPPSALVAATAAAVPASMSESAELSSAGRTVGKTVVTTAVTRTDPGASTGFAPLAASGR